MIARRCWCPAWSGGLLGVATLCAVALVGLPAASTAAPPPVAATLPRHIAVPAYFPPDDAGSWAELANAGPRLGFVIVNVDSGPGAQAETGWRKVTAALRASGTKIIGYVDTGYLGATGRPTERGATDPASWLVQAERDVRRWYAFYGAAIGGIFFDEADSDCGPTEGSDEYVARYRELDRYVHTHYPGSLTVDNPGVAVPACYSDAADVLVTFEGDYRDFSAGTAGRAPSQWQLSSDPTRFCDLVYDVPPAGIAAAMDRARQHNAGYVYLTDRTLAANPWLAPPSHGYFGTELASAAHP